MLEPASGQDSNSESDDDVDTDLNRVKVNNLTKRQITIVKMFNLGPKFRKSFNT